MARSLPASTGPGPGWVGKPGHHKAALLDSAATTAAVPRATHPALGTQVWPVTCPGRLLNLTTPNTPRHPLCTPHTSNTTLWEGASPASPLPSIPVFSPLPPSPSCQSPSPVDPQSLPPPESFYLSHGQGPTTTFSPGPRCGERPGARRGVPGLSKLWEQGKRFLSSEASKAGPRVRHGPQGPLSTSECLRSRCTVNLFIAIASESAISEHTYSNSIAGQVAVPPLSTVPSSTRWLEQYHLLEEFYSVLQRFQTLWDA